MTSCSVRPDPARDRPEVRLLESGPEGRVFSIHFLPGQSLPPHRNPDRISIEVVAGSGFLTLAADDTRPLTPGTAFQLEPEAVHALAAGDDGLEVRVTKLQACCDGC